MIYKRALNIVASIQISINQSINLFANKKAPNERVMLYATCYKYVLNNCLIKILDLRVCQISSHLFDKYIMCHFQ